MIHSGIAPLDLQPGGMIPGRLHLLTGGPGTGKSTACLHFLAAGLRAGERVALLTLDRLTDLVAHARFLGLELEPSLRGGQLVLLRYRSQFSSLLARAGLPDQMAGELRQLLAEERPARLVVDPLTPFLVDGTASQAAIAALALWLDGFGATTIFTYPADVSNGYDARLDPIVQRAASIVHVAHGEGGTYRMQIVQNRARATPPAAVRFALRPGAGMVLLGGKQREIGSALPGTNGGGPQPLDRAGLARAITARITHDHPMQYALVTLYCHNATAETLHELALIALGRMRVANGDLAAVLDDRVAVYLHGARLRDAGPFIERVRAQWARKHRAALSVESLAYPSDEVRLRTFLEIAQPS